LDELLGSETTLFGPAGDAQSRWIGTGEFEDIAQRWGTSDIAFGFGDPNTLTLETPFGTHLATLQLITDRPHPRLGNGLLAVLRLPWLMQDDQAVSQTNELNLLEAQGLTGIPLMGNWSTIPSADPNAHFPAYRSFIPNLLYRPGIAENFVLWALARARWIRETKFPEIADRPLIDILLNDFDGKTGKPST
jgi:hypothetical protein